MGDTFNDVQQLLHRYCYAHDEQDVEAFRTLFAEDATFLGATGPQAIVDAYTAGWGLLRFKRRHVLSNFILLEEEPDRAVMQSYVTLYLIKDEGELETHLIGVYVDHVVREGGEWKLHHRDAETDVEYNPGDVDIAKFLASVENN